MRRVWRELHQHARAGRRRRRQQPCGPIINVALYFLAARARLTERTSAHARSCMEMSWVHTSAQGLTRHAGLYHHAHVQNASFALLFSRLVSGKATRLSFLLILLFFCAAPFRLSATDFQSALDQQHIEGGRKAEQAISKALADRHFDSHGAKWPSHAFVTAVRAAHMKVCMGAVQVAIYTGLWTRFCFLGLHVPSETGHWNQKLDSRGCACVYAACSPLCACRRWDQCSAACHRRCPRF